MIEESLELRGTIGIDVADVSLSSTDNLDSLLSESGPVKLSLLVLKQLHLGLIVKMALICKTGRVGPLFRIGSALIQSRFWKKMAIIWNISVHVLE